MVKRPSLARMSDSKCVWDVIFHNTFQVRSLTLPVNSAPSRHGSISKSSTFKAMGKRQNERACSPVAQRGSYRPEPCRDQRGRPWLRPVWELTVASTLAFRSLCARVCVSARVCFPFRGLSSAWYQSHYEIVCVLANPISGAARVFTVDQPLPSTALCSN